MTETILSITALSTQGEGIGRVEGKAVFVPFTLPGEKWVVETAQRRKQFDRALPIRKVGDCDSAARKRTKPRCPYFGACGGCQLQHLLYAKQLPLKQQWIEETFRRVGHLDVNAGAPVPSNEWEYRNKLALPLLERDGKVIYAFHQIFSPSRYVSIDDCLIAHPDIRALMQPLLSALNRAKPVLTTYSNRRNRGSRVILRVIDGWRIAHFFDVRIPQYNLDDFVNILINQEQVLDELILPGERKQTIRFQSDKHVRSQSGISYNSFLQVNDQIRTRLYDCILSLPFTRRQAVLDGYCGVGILTRRLGETFTMTHGVENNLNAAEDARRLVQQNGLDNRVNIFSDSLEQFLQKTSHKYDVVILNPPRSGLSKEVTSQILERKPQELVMISCHPAALARDTSAFIQEGYRIETLQPFDMFPQTYHLETVLYIRR